MSPRRQRRTTLPTPEPSTPPSLPRRLSARLRSRTLPNLLRKTPPIPTPPLSQPPSPPFVSVRVLDFVTVPPTRLSSPDKALPPVDQTSRPPSYPIPPPPLSDDIDRILDAEEYPSSSVSAGSEPDYSDHMFMIGDSGHIDRLVSIVKRSTPSEETSPLPVNNTPLHTTSPPHTEDFSPATSVASLSARTTSQLTDTTVCSELSDEPSLVLTPVRESPVSPARRACLLPKKAPSPVKYTFRPPSGPPSAPRRDRPEIVCKGGVVVPAVRAARDGNGPSLGAVRDAVETIDAGVVLRMATPPALGIFRRRRESEESVRTGSTEYWEDEYTRFIGRKSVSPLRLRSPRPVLSKIVAQNGAEESVVGRLECRSNSTVSVATSDDEYQPGLARYANKS